MPKVVAQGEQHAREMILIAYELAHEYLLMTLRRTLATLTSARCWSTV